MIVHTSKSKHPRGDVRSRNRCRSEVEFIAPSISIITKSIKVLSTRCQAVKMQCHVIDIKKAQCITLLFLLYNCLPALFSEYKVQCSPKRLNLRAFIKQFPK
jgi:hypothetical protein